MLSRILSALVLLSLALTAPAEEPSCERKARVALALASAGKPTVAPGPRTVPFPGYRVGYKTALADGKPLVVYVGCTGKHPIERIDGAVVAVAPDLTGYEAGTIVVCYPSDKTVFVHAQFECKDHGDKVTAAVKDAVKKVVTPPAKAERAAPRPLSWDI